MLISIIVLIMRMVRCVVVVVCVYGKTIRYIAAGIMRHWVVVLLRLHCP